jgi:hypothetical protein
MSFFLGLLVGFFISMFSVLVGAVVQKARVIRPPVPQKPICLCNHAFGSHEDGNKCQVHIYLNYEWKNCACTTYVGPDPIASGLWVAPKTP